MRKFSFLLYCINCHNIEWANNSPVLLSCKGLLFWIEFLLTSLHTVISQPHNMTMQVKIRMSRSRWGPVLGLLDPSLWYQVCKPRPQLPPKPQIPCGPCGHRAGWTEGWNVAPEPCSRPGRSLCCFHPKPRVWWKEQQFWSAEMMGRVSTRADKMNRLEILNCESSPKHYSTWYFSEKAGKYFFMIVWSAEKMRWILLHYSS